MKYEPILSQMAGRAAHAIHQSMKYFRPILLQWETGFACKKKPFFSKNGYQTWGGVMKNHEKWPSYLIFFITTKKIQTLNITSQSPPNDVENGKKYFSVILYQMQTNIT